LGELVSNESRQSAVAPRDSHPPQDADTSQRGQPHYLIVGLAVGFAHLILFLHDIADGTGFFRADRAQQRFHAMRNLLGSSGNPADFLACLVKQGNIGDYGIHAFFYSLGGAPAVIAFQVLLAVAAALCVTYIAWRAFPSKNIAVAAGLLYGFLPQTLAFPHQLLSESISNPCVIFGIAGLLRALQKRDRVTAWCMAGLAMGIGAMVRPALILLPLVTAGLWMALDRTRLHRPKAAAFAVSGLAPLMLWSLFMFSQVGKFGPGESNQDLGLNFSQSTAKVLLSEGAAPADGRVPEWLPKRLTFGEYFHYMRAYPKGFANLYFKNVLVMIADSGIGRLYVDLLGFGADERLRLQDPALGWRAQLTNHGPLAMLENGWERAPGTIVAGVLGAIGFALVNIGMVAAYWMLLRRRSFLGGTAEPLMNRWCAAVLLTIPIYVLATSQVVAYAPSRLRSQGEFAVAILACFGWVGLCSAWRRRRTRGSTWS
jgi:4-amino-4-deoxy-L-arabinose transferase-like glycosyltransferase